MHWPVGETNIVGTTVIAKAKTILHTTRMELEKEDRTFFAFAL
jgi:hypothetical protein